MPYIEKAEYRKKMLSSFKTVPGVSEFITGFTINTM